MKVVGNLHILGQKSIIKMNSRPSSNWEYSGWISEEIAEINLTRGDVLYLIPNKHTFTKACANSINLMPARALALEDILAGDIGLVLRFGSFRHGFAGDTYNLNEPFIYVSDSIDGGFTKFKPTAPGSIIQKIGTPMYNNVGWFDFNSTLVEIQADGTEKFLSY